MSAGEISVRAARAADGPALERLHADVARYYADAAGNYFEAAGSVQEEPAGPAADRHSTLRLVAESDGEVVGALVARLLDAEDDGDRALEPDPPGTRLRIEYLATAAAHRRLGVGSRLVEAAEAWGRAAGAELAETTTFRGSPLSVPFWEDRMGYEERSVKLRKRL